MPEPDASPDPGGETWFVIDAATGAETTFHGDPFDAMRQWEDHANAAFPDAHGIATHVDQPWARFDHEYPIFGLAWTLEHQLRVERASYPDFDQPGTEDALEWEAQALRLRQHWDRGLRYGRAWSIDCPDGELGSTHCSLMVVITEAMLDYARRCHWHWETMARGPSKETAPWRMLVERLERLERRQRGIVDTPPL